MKTYKPFYFLFIILFITKSFASMSTVVKGDISFYYMQRLSNQSLVNIPFRMLNLDVMHQNNNFDVNGKFALEYRNRKDVDFMASSDPVDINTVLRELYITYYLKNGEISLGKKIYTWGSVDENSPIDIVNAYDNYYLLIGTAERKLGSYSMSFDYYVNNGTLKLSGIYAPMHNATRYPIDDNEYEFGLPITILPSQILSIEKPAEMGLSMQQSFNRGDITFSYFKGYNRVPSFSGFNRYTKVEIDDDENSQTYNQWILSGGTYVDLLYSYHLTEASNIGGVFLFDDFTIRFDYALFKTYDDQDMEEYFDHDCLSGIGYGYSCNGHFISDSPNSYKYVVDSDANGGAIDQETGNFVNGDYHSYPLRQKAEYSQQTFQLELPLSDNYQINMQYFKYKFYDSKFSFDDPLDSGTELEAPLLELPEGCDINDLETCIYFTPGMGAPFAMLSSETFFLSIEKTILDDDLKVTLGSLMDLDEGFGELVSFEADYNVGNGLNAILGITKVIGDSEVDDYVFNEIEDFSNVRFELKYNF